MEGNQHQGFLGFDRFVHNVSARRTLWLLFVVVSCWYPPSTTVTLAFHPFLSCGSSIDRSASVCATANDLSRQHHRHHLEQPQQQERHRLCRTRLFSTSEKETDTDLKKSSSPPATTKMSSTTSAQVAQPGNDGYSTYTDAELRAALDGLLAGSDDPTSDGRHLFGRDDPNHEMSKLQVITATRILDYERYLNRGPSSEEDGTDTAVAPSESQLVEEMQTFWADHGPVLNLRDVITNRAPRMALAAEFKRASPSKGDIATHLDAGEQGQQYASAGADIISVLTEPRWFLGSLQDMTKARLETVRKVLSDDGTLVIDRPAILRKEFTTNKYQITEALAKGADTILLIVAVLPQHLLKELIDHARSFGMEPLVEVHADAELDVAIQAGAKVIGVNNRNLHTFQMDLQTTERVAEKLLDAHGGGDGCILDHSTVDTARSAKYTLCSLSGMSTAFDVDRYRQVNVGMCLIGESLMRAADPKVAIAGLCLDPKDWERTQQEQQPNGGGGTIVGGGAYTRGTQLIKVCGITNPDDALVACQAGANLIGVIFVPESKRCVTPEQGRAVVDAVRAFGERTQRETVRRAAQHPQPLTQLVSNAKALEDASRRPLVVGVFQNQSPEFISDMVEMCGLDLVQLHGKEGMEAADPALCGGVPAIRVVDIETDPTTGTTAARDAVDTILSSLTTHPIAILLDTSIKGGRAGGGTGVTFDWTVAERIQNSGLPVIIAGGLSTDNVQHAVHSTRPWGVDVSSGVEANPGIKDHDKVRKFVSGARAAAIEASKGF